MWVQIHFVKISFSCFLRQNLAAVLEELDDDLYERYTEPRMRVFKALLREAVLQDGIDWYHAPCPTGRPRFLLIRVDSIQLSSQPSALKYARFSIIWLKFMPISAPSHQHSSKKFSAASLSN